MMRTMRSIATPVAAAALLIATLLSDLFFAPMARFWSDHAMVTNLASSAIFILVGAAIVDRWLKREELRKLRVIQSTAYDAVARSPMAQWRAMWMLINGGRQLGEADFEWPAYDVAELQRLLSRHQIKEVHHSAVTRGRVENLGELDRLCQLVSDEEWRYLAYRVMRRTVHGSRLVTARWAQLFVSSKQSSDVLQELTSCANDLQELRIYMLKWTYDGEELDAAGVEAFVKLWRKADVNAVVVSTQLEGGGAMPDLSNWSASERLLQEKDRQLLRETLAAGSPVRRVRRLYAGDVMPQGEIGADRTCDFEE